jgi:hypothetical protein
MATISGAQIPNSSSPTRLVRRRIRPARRRTCAPRHPGAAARAPNSKRQRKRGSGRVAARATRREHADLHRCTILGPIHQTGSMKRLSRPRHRHHRPDEAPPHAAHPVGGVSHIALPLRPTPPRRTHSSRNAQADPSRLRPHRFAPTLHAPCMRTARHQDR